MFKNYSQEELNQILLSKKLNEFYLAIIENRQELLTNEEYADIINRESTIYGDNKEKVKELFEKVNNDTRLKDFTSEIMKAMYSIAQIRHTAILTMIGNDVYDIANARFENLKRNKIIHFDNLTNYYNENNARIRIFTPNEEPQLMQNTALLDVDDESIVQIYENNYIQQEESKDLTSEFLIEAKAKIYTLKNN